MKTEHMEIFELSKFQILSTMFENNSERNERMINRGVIDYPGLVYKYYDFEECVLYFGSPNTRWTKKNGTYK